MVFYKWFSNAHDRRLAREEAVAASEKHGDRAEEALLAKAGQTRSSQRRKIYKLARHYIRTELASPQTPRD